MTNPKVLFVDDEPSVRKTLAVILRQQGFDVTVAATVPEALDIIKAEKFDVLLSDLNIGEAGDGFTLVSAMRRTQPDACTFIITGFPDFESALKAIRKQVDDYFVKPVEPRALVSGIRQHLMREKAAPVQPPTKRVADVIRENMDTICRLWLEEVERDPELMVVQMSDSERVDHIPGVLAALISMLESERDEISDSASTAAREHGQLRRSQDYTVPMLVIEARLLQAKVTQTLQQNLLRIEISTLIPDIIRVGEGLNAQLEQSIRAFEQAEPIPIT
jgi:DNA-binding response OmpR family regulator